MPLLLRCPSCKKPLKVRDELAGKKVKCPGCGTAVPVPLPEPEKEPEVLVEEETEPEAPPKAAVTAKPPPREAETVEELEDESVTAAKPKRKADKNLKPEQEESEWVPCPKCGAEDPKRVKSTFWGASLGPKLFNHVRCRDCRTTYNGKTGSSNIIPALGCLFIFFLLLLAIAGALGGVVYLKRFAPQDEDKDQKKKTEAIIREHVPLTSPPVII